MVIFLDGIDMQVIGIGAPLITRELGIAKSLFGWAISAGMAGAMTGALIGGVLADKLGRKSVLLCATIFFGCATVATATANDFPTLLCLRFLTGIGLGGAVPSCLSLASEYAPSSRRASVVSLLWAAFPLGGALGALLNSYIVGALGWRPLFVVWGVAPVLVAALHSVTLPESVWFLLRKGGREARVAAILNRIEPGAVERNAQFLTPETTIRQPTSPAELFGPKLRITTWSLAALAFIVLGLLTVGATWTPTLLTPYGYTPAAGALVVAFNGLGSFCGTLSAGFLLERWGIARVLLPALLGAAGAFLGLGFATFLFEAMAIASFCAGLTLGVASSSILALAALTYPTVIRSSGTGFAMGMGRFGAVVLPLLVGLLVAARWNIVGVMAALASLAALAGPCVWVLEHHRSNGKCP
jgi:MFS transporter, AAHS family, 4-hydroxybenzoate transporter